MTALEKLVEAVSECAKRAMDNGNTTDVPTEVWDGVEECLPAAKSELAALTNWEESAKQFARDCEYYRGLVVKIGEMIGQEAYVSDDGSVQQDVLCDKVPELVGNMIQDNILRSAPLALLAAAGITRPEELVKLFDAIDRLKAVFSCGIPGPVAEVFDTADACRSKGSE